MSMSVLSFSWWIVLLLFFLFFLKNIRKYLLTEAKEKNRSEFLQGWQTAVTKVNGSTSSSGVWESFRRLLLNPCICTSSKLFSADHVEGGGGDTGGYTWELERARSFSSHQVLNTFCKWLGDLSLISGQLNIHAAKTVAGACVGTRSRTEWAGDSASSLLLKGLFWTMPNGWDLVREGTG